MDVFVKFNKRRTMISLESKSNEDTEIVIEKFLDYLKSSNLSNEAWIRKGKNESLCNPLPKLKDLLKRANVSESL